jgi:hypothetical protein
MRESHNATVMELILLVYSSGQVILFRLFFEKDRFETTLKK